MAVQPFRRKYNTSDDSTTLPMTVQHFWWQYNPFDESTTLPMKVQTFRWQYNLSNDSTTLRMTVQPFVTSVATQGNSHLTVWAWKWSHYNSTETSAIIYSKTEPNIPEGVNFKQTQHRTVRKPNTFGVDISS